MTFDIQKPHSTPIFSRPNISRTSSFSNTSLSESCLDLALIGEKFCITGDCKKGIRYFNRAIEIGTDDLTVLSAIYCQLGNAYFYLEDYNHSLEFHRHDLSLAQKMKDKFCQAKALGNLSVTLKCIEQV